MNVITMPCGARIEFVTVEAVIVESIVVVVFGGVVCVRWTKALAVRVRRWYV